MSAFLTSVAVPNKTQYQSPSKNLNIVEEKYLNYTIEQNTKYSDIDRIQEKYLNLAIKKYETFNRNKAKIQKLKEEYKEVLRKIEDEILKNYVMQNDTLMKSYNKQIKDTMQAIKVKSHEQEAYIHSYNRLYHSNILIKKRIENEIKYEAISDKHYLEYKILKNHALLSFNKESNKFEKMKNFQELSNVHFKFNMLKKAKIVNTLDFQIDVIKKEMKTTEQKLKNFNKIEQNLKKDINMQKRKYDLYKKEYNCQIKEYHRDDIEFRKILKFLNVKDVNELISNFNTIKGEYQSLHSQFKFYNAEVSNLNNSLTNYENDLNDLYEKIKQKQIEENKKNKEAMEDVNLIQKKKEINEATFFVTQSTLLSEKKGLILQTIMNFLVKNIRKMKDIIYIENIYKNNSQKQKIYFDIVTGNKDIHVNYTEVDYNELQSMICVFLIFADCFYNLLYISMNTIITETVRFQPEFLLDTNFSSYYIFAKQYLQVYSEFINNAFKQQEARNRILKQKERELLTNLKVSEDDLSSQNTKKTISQSVLYRNFLDYIEKEGINFDFNNNSALSTINNKPKKKTNAVLQDNKKTINNSTINNSISQSNVNSLYSTFFSSKQLNKTFVSTHPHQLFKIMSRYQNELVEKEPKKKPVKRIGNYSLIKKKNPQLHRSNSVLQSRHSSTRNEGQAIKAFTQKKMINYNTNEEYDPDDNVDDSEEIRKKEEIEKKKKSQEKTVYQFFKNNPEMALIYKRINDLRLLDLKYFKRKGKDNENLDEIYYNFEKKYLKKSKVESVYSMKNLRKDKKKPIKEKTISKNEKEPSISDSVNISRKRSCSILYNIKNKDNENSMEYPVLGLKRSSRSFHIDSRKNNIINNNLANILQVSPNFFDKN